MHKKRISYICRLEILSNISYGTDINFGDDFPATPKTKIRRPLPNRAQLRIRISLSKSAQICVLGEDQITERPAKILAREAASPPNIRLGDCAGLKILLMKNKQGFRFS